MKARNAALSSLTKCWTRFPQVVTNVRVREKRPLEELDEVMELVAQADKELKAQGGRILLRYSGTEPKARLLLEGADANALNLWSKKIADAIRDQLS
jgi:phosphoglucosamine mutase